jgi:hypothetical protein
MRSFRLYQEHPWFPVEDYAALYDLAVLVRPSSVLEFGPGASTFAFVESDVPRIVTCEDDGDWFEQSRLRFRDYPSVTVQRYQDIAAEERFGLGFVDGPVRTEERGAVIDLALARCCVVAVHDAERDGVRQAIARSGRRVERVGLSVAVLWL